jgi:hypothetical protein
MDATGECPGLELVSSEFDFQPPALLANIPLLLVPGYSFRIH